MAIFNLKRIKLKAKEEIERAKTLKELDEIFEAYFGQQGKIRAFTNLLKSLPERKRKLLGKKINEFKALFESALEEKSAKIREKMEKEVEDKEKLDITIPGKKIKIGNLHPLTLAQRKIVEIFRGLGFSLVEGPEIENEWYNFDALNIPKDHPARDFWDTLYIKSQKLRAGGQRLLLRTHTSPVQIRFMEKNNPPFRIVAPGRVFRYEATDAFHEVNFHQVEGLMVDRSVSIANFKAIIQEFFKNFFEKSVKIRQRPSFFPFTEPSFEIDISCLNCQGRGCALCSQKGWLEVMGAGLVHPNVFKNVGYSKGEWQGFAFGLGLERLAMIKYRINDIRLFYSGDLRFLEQF